MSFFRSHSSKATLIGLSAPVCWGMSVGMVRGITEAFGMAAGLAVFNWVTCLFLLLVIGLPKLSAFPKKFLLLGVPMGNLYTICFCLSLYLANGEQQTVEVGMINYLWPCGMFISKTIIDAHEETIGVESIDNDGCEFWFTLTEGIQPQKRKLKYR